MIESFALRDSFQLSFAVRELDAFLDMPRQISRGGWIELEFCTASWLITFDIINAMILMFPLYQNTTKQLTLFLPP
jgi:hypothetical protein